jgi:hypothetical protein
MTAGLDAGETRGDALLIERLRDRPPAQRRLAATIGDDLARFLVDALAKDQRARWRRRGRRGSSSP